MKIVVIGSGNVATHLSLALHSISEEIIQVYSPNLANAEALAKLVLATPINNLQEVDQNADLYIIAVKDDAIASVVAQLPILNGVVVHTAGTVDIQVIAALQTNAGVFYPLQTFSKQKQIDFRGVPIFLEASNTLSIELLCALAKKISDQVYQVDGDKRKILHLSAVFACNFTNHLYAIADQILEDNGLKFEMIKPLIVETNSKILNNKPIDVQTGPAIRGDRQTMDAHKRLLTDHPNLLSIYQLLSDSIKKTLK